MNRLTVLFVFVFCFAGLVHAQDGEKVRSVGVFFSSFDNFGLRYKFGNERRLFRITALNLSTNRSELSGTTSGTNSKTFNTGIGLALGVQMARPIVEKLSFFYGPELEFYYTFQNSKVNSATNKSHRIGGTIGLITGVAYNVSPKIILSAEVEPAFEYSHNKTPTGKTDSFRFSFNNYMAGITLAYVFSK